jgi:hypothetical protein
VLWVVLGGAYNFPSENLTYISSHLHTHTRQPSPQTAIHPAQPRRCILMYKHVPVSSGRSPLVPVVRNEKESRHRDATHIMYICVYLDCRQPTGTRKGETNKFRVCTLRYLVIRQADLVMCSTIQSEDWKPSSWASFKQPRGSALERASGIRFWNTGP